MVKNGRRGSMSGELIVKGVQGHIAYPHLASKPDPPARAGAGRDSPPSSWDEGNEYFPPTTWQVSEPARRHRRDQRDPGPRHPAVNFRFSTASTVEACRQRVHAILDKHGLDYDLKWSDRRPALPHPARRPLGSRWPRRSTTRPDVDTELSTTGGTSDGRFIARICPQVIEFGPPNASHPQDRRARRSCAIIDPLKNVYRTTCSNNLLA